MKWILGFVLGFIGLTGLVYASPKVLICHNTGSLSNPTVTIEVSENAVDAHIRNHGDTRGACVNQPTPQPNPNPDPKTPDVVEDTPIPKPETTTVASPDTPAEVIIGK